MLSYMRGNEVGYEIEAEAPPNGAEDIARDFLHFPHHADAVVDLGQKLEQED